MSSQSDSESFQQSGSPTLISGIQAQSATPIELEQFNIDVQGLMRGLVHELRNPLSAILTAASLLGGSGLEQGTPLVDEESAMLLEVVTKEARRMNAILTEFSYFVKPPPSHIESFDAAKALRLLVSRLEKDGILASIQVLDKLPDSLFVHADQNQLETAFSQVLQNAAEELNHSGELILEGDLSGSQASISISDTGRGVNEEALSKAFQPFFSHKASSTGLGLSLARGAVRASGGEITLKNRTDVKGARILIILPTGLPENEQIS